MANGRQSKNDTSWRDSDGFMLIPTIVLNSSAYIGLSDKAKCLLVLMSMQHSRTKPNNGRLICTKKYMSKWGWNSSDKLNRAKRELIDAGFLYETVKGHRPNKASLYALTFFSLSKQQGYDYGAERGFKRSAYQNATLSPANGIRKATIAPPQGLRSVPVAPTHGIVNEHFYIAPNPPDGLLLDKPSEGGRNRIKNDVDSSRMH